MWDVAFWKGAAERSLKSAAQALLLLWAGDGVFGAWSLDWPLAGGVAAGAALLSLATSLVSAPVGPGGPSLVRGPAEAELDRLSVVTRGLVTAAAKAGGGAPIGSAHGAALQVHVDRAREVLADMGRATP